MSDYFGRLVDRALGQGPRVEPRLRSAFEPTSRGDDSLSEAPIETIAPAKRPPGLPPESRSPGEDAGATRVFPPEAGDSAESSSAERLLVPEYGVPAPVRPVAVPSVGSRDPAGEPAADDERATSPTVSRDGDENPSPLVIEKTSVAHERPAAASARSPEIRVITRGRPLRRPESPHESSRPPAATAPIVRVTIGRVEVRALLSSPAPARPSSAPAAPKLPLDEYLRQRNGGLR